MTQPVDVSVLLVTYNSRAFIDECIASVNRTVRDHSFEIIAVDNASTDGSADHVRRTHPDVRVIDMGRNAGFSAANNRGYIASTGRHILLLNGDAFVDDGAIDAMVAFLDSHADAGVAAPRLNNLDGTDQQTARAFPTPGAAVWGRRSPLTKLFPNNRYARRYLVGRDVAGDEPFEIDWVSGACMMVPRRVIDRVGALDPGYFMYWEDADWCRRIKDAGYRVWCIPTATARHAEGGSRRGWPAPQVRHFHRSAYRYYATHDLRGAKAIFKPVAATALGARAGFVMARERFRRAAPSDTTTRPAPRVAAGSIQAGELQ